VVAGAPAAPSASNSPETALVLSLE